MWDQTAGCQIENLTAGYGEGTVLTGLDLEVPRGAITEIIEHRVQPVEPEPGLLIAEWDSVKMTFRAKGGDFRVEIVCQDATMLPDLRTDISIQIG